MTILRSREVLPVETLKKRFMDNSPSSKSTQPSTPNLSSSRNSHCFVDDPCPDVRTPDFGWLPGAASNLRRSRRIASRLSGGEASGEVAASGGRGKGNGVSEVDRVCLEEGRCESGSGNAKSRVLGSGSDAAEHEFLGEAEGAETEERALAGLSIAQLGHKEEEKKGRSSDLDNLESRIEMSEDVMTVKKSKRKRKSRLDTSQLDGEERGFLGLRSGKKIAKEMVGGVGRIESDCGKAVVEQEFGEEDKGAMKVRNDGNEEAVVEQSEKDQLFYNDHESIRARMIFTEKETGKGKLVEDDEPQESIGAVKLDLNLKLMNDIDNASVYENDAVKGGERCSKEEKGKGIMINDNLASYADDPVDLNLECEIKNSSDNAVSDSVHLEGNVGLEVQNEVIQTSVTGIASRARTRFRDIARRNASRFAHFVSEQEMENYPSHDAEIQRSPKEGDKENEDWPGPFSTAMKIIKDREKRLNSQPSSSSQTNRTPHKIWSPKEDKSSKCPMRSAPLLLDMCLEVLSHNCDAIISLERIPDALRHKLSQLLCDSRRMNGHSLELLVSGSPSEVCVRDCSWLTEEEFARIFKLCDTNILTVCLLNL